MKAIEGGKTKVTHPNSRVNGAQGHETFAKGAPKTMDGGMDLSGDAKNCIGGKIHPTRAESATSKPHSRNQ